MSKKTTLTKKVGRNQQVVEIFKPVVTFSKCLGTFPLQLEMDWHSGRLEYNFKFLSSSNCFCLLLTFFKIGVLLGITAGMQFGYEWLNDLLGLKALDLKKQLSGNTTSVAIFVGESFSVLGPIEYVLNTYLITVSSISFGKFLTNWQDFEQLCLDTFPHENHNPFNSIPSIRNKLFILYATLGIIPNIANIIIFNLFYTSFVSIRGIILVGFVTSLTTLTWLVREFNSILMFQTLIKALNRVNSGIISSDDEKVSLTEVQQWIQLLQMIRSQIVLTEKTLGTNEIFCLVFNGWTYLSTLFLFYRSVVSEIDLGLISSGIWMCSWMFIRLLFRAVTAEKIPREEKAIALTLMSKSYKNMDTITKLEIKCLVDTILTCPSHIRFGNVVTFNRGLILRIITNVLGYLIVLIQFDSSSSKL